MGIRYRFEDFHKALIHEINTLERYDDEVTEGHQLSVVLFFNQGELDHELLADILAKASRKSDLIFHDKGRFILLMPATNPEGAKHTLLAMHDCIKNLEHLHILSYPRDGFLDETFYAKCSSILEGLGQ